MFKRNNIAVLQSLFQEHDGPWAETDPAFHRIENLLAISMEPMDYQKRIRDKGIDVSDVNVLDGLDEEDCAAVLTYHFRMDRFSEGHMLQIANNGYLARLVECMERFAQD